MLGRKDDLLYISVCQCSDCKVYYCCSLAVEPDLGHLGFLMYCSRLATESHLGHLGHGKFLGEPRLRHYTLQY